MNPITADQAAELALTARNLRALAVHIDRYADAKRLNMAHYASIRLTNPLGAYYSSAALTRLAAARRMIRPDCGTCACALGWSLSEPSMPADPKWLKELMLGAGDGRQFFMEYCQTYYPYLCPPETFFYLNDDATTSTQQDRYGSLESKGRCWRQVFGPDLSSDKPEVIGRLEAMAERLETEAATYAGA